MNTAPQNTSSTPTNQPQPPPAAPQASPAEPQAPAQRQPWDIHDGETPEAFSAFRTYLSHSPDITLEELATELQRTYDSVRQLSRRHHWRERAAACRQHEAQLQAESLHQALTHSNKLLVERANILQQQQWEQTQHLSDLADYARDLALKGKDIPPRLDHVARLYNVVDKLGHRAVQPLSAALLPAAEDPVAALERETSINKVYGPMAAAGVVPSVKELIERRRNPAQPSTPEPPASTPPPAPANPQTS